jgi:hypothetical protein
MFCQARRLREGTHLSKSLSLIRRAHELGRDARKNVERNVSPLGILQSVLRALRALGPYALLELVMPGGTLLALLLYAYRRRAAAVSAAEAKDREFSLRFLVDSRGGGSS